MRVKAFITAAACLASNSDAQTVITYGYNARGELTAVRDGQGVRSDYQNDAASNRTRLRTVKQFQTVWEAEALPHGSGYADADGWAANVNTNKGHITYGPYTTNVSTGQRVAVWRLLIDESGTSDNSVVVTLDVWDASTGEQVAVRSISRHDWSASMRYQVFELPFNMDGSRAGHSMEIRTYYNGSAYVRVDKVGYY